MVGGRGIKMVDVVVDCGRSVEIVDVVVVVADVGGHVN